MPFPQMDPGMSPLANGGVARAQPRMLAPGYYSQECNAHKPCDQGELDCSFSVQMPNVVFSKTTSTHRWKTKQPYKNLASQLLLLVFCTNQKI